MQQETIETPPAEIAKRRLKKYSRLLEDIDAQMERLERMEAEIVSAAPTSGSHGGGSLDKTALQIAKKVDLAKTIEAMIAVERTEANRLEAIIAAMANDRERQVIRLRYLDRMSWFDISAVFFSDRRDFAHKKIKYQKAAYRIHSGALISLGKAIAEAKTETKKD